MPLYRDKPAKPEVEPEETKVQAPAEAQVEEPVFEEEVPAELQPEIDTPVTLPSPTSTRRRIAAPRRPKKQSSRRKPEDGPPPVPPPQSGIALEKPVEAADLSEPVTQADALTVDPPAARSEPEGEHRPLRLSAIGRAFIKKPRVGVAMAKAYAHASPWDREYGISSRRISAYLVLAATALVLYLVVTTNQRANDLPTEFSAIADSKIEPFKGKIEYQNTLEGFLGSAQAKAVQYASACFNFTNLQDDAQVTALKSIGAPDCGWNGFGSNTVGTPVVAANLGWHDDRQAMVAIMVQPAGQALWMTYYVPFVTNDGRLAEFAGPGSLFGSHTVVSRVANACDADTIPDKLDVDKLTRTLQTFMAAMTGNLNIDTELLMAPGSSYQPFYETDKGRPIRDPASNRLMTLVRKPVLGEPQPCSFDGNELTVRVNVSFSGPGSGKAGFEMPYAFKVVQEKAGRSTAFRIAAWGPNSVPGSSVQDLG